MIINFKLFENNNNYNVGDFVLIEGSYFDDGSPKKGKIIGIEQKTFLKIYDIIFYDIIFIEKVII